MPDKEYRITSSVGDVVLLPNGKDLGVIVGYDILEAGHVKEVRVRPLVGVAKYIFGIFRYSSWRFAEDEINKLKKVGEIACLKRL